MIPVYAITVFIVALYFAYPLWLMLLSSHAKDGHGSDPAIKGISLILLTYNGAPYLEEKIRALKKELESFSCHELIILDDHSTDGSHRLLETFAKGKHTRLIRQDEHRGIPFAMNLGIREAKFDHVIFCDQRQNLTDNIFKRLTDPLRKEDVGAVSACISHRDKQNCYSLMRRYENCIKRMESRSGNLIGVYGPLYAIRKNCYVPIPENIILDDLYLSLCIMSRKKIRLVHECQIIDEAINELYDYKRARRYLMGFRQILKDRQIWASLTRKQAIMLLWHKYLRLLIPVLLFASYAGTGVAALSNEFYRLAFLIMSLALAASFLPVFARYFKLPNYIRINMLYFIAMLMIGIERIAMPFKKQ